MNLPTSAKQEPPTTGKVILFTSNGQLEIELWTREAPLACRNFIQHCLEGYYNNLIFHRIIPSFMIQGGDPTGTGTGGESVYGEPFADQFNQRLKFVRRGIVAMANSGKNTNASQFFITFGQCEHLNKKHTIFGKIVGDTIYNLMAMQSIDTDEDDRPFNPPTIRRAKIILNPFDDIQVTVKKPEQQQTPQIKKQILKQSAASKKQEIKKLKKKNKLTFDCDQIEETGYKVKSSHDMLNDSSLSSKVALTTEDFAKRLKQKQDEQKRKRQMKDRIMGLQGDDDINSLLVQQMKKKRKLNEQSSSIFQDQILNYNMVYNPQTQRKEISWDKPIPEENQEQSKMKKLRELQHQEKQKMKIDQLNFKKIKEGSRKEKRKMLINQQIQLLSNAERIRYDFLKKNQLQKIQTNLFQKLNSFTAKLGNKEGKGNDWMRHSLKFHIDSEAAYKFDQKKKLVHEQGDLEDGGLKIQVDNDPVNNEFNVDELYDMIHKQK